MKKDPPYDLNPGLRRQLLLLCLEDYADEQVPVAECVGFQFSKEPGTIIGRYKLIRALGHGGLGEVYWARQLSPVIRNVAIKILRPDILSAEALDSFRGEQQAIALLDHPHIGHIFDAGVTEGRPYFVMEHIDGQAITRYCDEKEMPIRERLLLVCQACDAVAFANQHGLIHRDLKPPNILVKDVDDGKLKSEPVVVVIDWSVDFSKMGSPISLLFPGEGSSVGTLGYISPEMVQTDLPPSTTWDAYALAVVVYKMVTGTLPFDPASLPHGLSDVEKLTIIHRNEPRHPGTAVRELEDRAEAVARKRGVTVKQLNKLLDGELGLMLMKGLRKNPTERYQSPRQFGDEIRRYLQNLPLLAGPGSTRYKVKKFVQRNRGWVAALIIFLLSVVIGAAGSLHFAVISRRQERKTATALDRIERLFYASSIKKTELLLKEHHPTDAKATLDGCPETLRRSEWEWLNSVANQQKRSLQGHTDEIGGIVFNAASGTMLTHDRHTIRRWDADFRESEVLLNINDANIAAIGTDLFACCRGTTIEIRTLEHQSRIVSTFRGHDAKITSVRFDPYGRILSCSIDGKVKMWTSSNAVDDVIELLSVDIGSGHSEARFNPLANRFVAWSRAAETQGGGYRRGAAYVYSIAGSSYSGQPECKVGKGLSVDFAWSSDGATLLEIASSGIVALYDPATGKMTCMKSIVPLDELYTHGFLAYRGNGSFVYASPYALTIFTVVRMNPIPELPEHWEDRIVQREQLVLDDDERRPNCLAVQPMTNRVILGHSGGGLTIWDPNVVPGRPQPSNKLPTPVPRDPNSMSGISILRNANLEANGRLMGLSPDSQFLLLADLWKDSLLVMKAETMQELTALEGNHNWSPYEEDACCFSQDSELVAVANRATSEITIWDTRTGDEEIKIKGMWPRAGAMVFLPNSRVLVSGSRDENIVTFWDGHTGQKLNTLLAREEGGVTALAVGGKYLAASIGNAVVVFDLKTRQQISTLIGHREPITGLTFNHDGSLLASCAEDVRVWETLTGACQRILRARNYLPLSVAFSADDRVVSGGRQISLGQGGSIKLWYGDDSSECLTMLRPHNPVVWLRSSANALYYQCRWGPCGMIPIPPAEESADLSAAHGSEGLLE